MSIRKIIPEIILASQSKSRKLLLDKLKIDYSIIPAHVDETAIPYEQPENLVSRLSKLKALTVLDKLNNPPKANTIIIASDQVAVVNNKIYGKPENYKNACTQLELFSNNTIKFITGLAVIHYNKSTKKHSYFYTQEISKIKLKKLRKQQIKNYLLKEEPYQCAASFKIEGLGIRLVDSIECKDYNAIIGLPIIKLIKILDKINLDILDM